MRHPNSTRPVLFRRLMSTTSPQRRDPWSEAVGHLRGADPAMGALMERVGPCLLRPKRERERFTMLVRSIVGQQISTKAAAAINLRLHALAGPTYSPPGLIALGEAGLRGVGVSSVKARYILNLSEAVAGGHVPLNRIGRWDDDGIVARLTTVKGIGVWTAEMFLIFTLNRPDVLPVTDLGIRAGLRDWHGLADVPVPQHCRELAEPWRPYRTVACWYLWRRRDTAQPAK
jgi:DNA-3-methyladenine glycosylase II